MARTNMIPSNLPSSSSSRQIAPLPHHVHPHPPSQSQPAPAQTQFQASQPRSIAYNPTPNELRQGAKNPLLLAIRSGIEEEIDYALPRLVVASSDDRSQFLLKYWVDSVSALKEWPEKWLDSLESEAALAELRASRDGISDSPEEVVRTNGHGSNVNGPEDRKRKRDLALGAMPEWATASKTIERATNSLLVLRNASFNDSNAEIICRASFLSYLDRFFSLPIPFILELTLRYPEPVHHILTIVQSIFPFLRPEMEVRRIFATVFPRLLIDTRDSAMMNNLLPLIISGLIIPSSPAPPSDLIPHLLQLLVLRPASPILELTLDLLISLSLNSIHSRSILSQPNFSAHLKSLVYLLEYGAKPVPATWDAAVRTQGIIYRNPASEGIRAEMAARRRAHEREAMQRQMELYGGAGVVAQVADRAPVLPQAAREKLYAMREPARSIQWMHENFVYSPTSQLLQVMFWHAYRDFFQNPSTIEALLSASEVIKNVTIAFPGAMAKVISDDMGRQKFVIAGMGFRKSSDDEDRFNCLWKGCTSGTGSAYPGQLLSHIQMTHLTGPFQPTRCAWANCTYPTFSLSHLLTHLPLAQAPSVPEVVSSDPSVPEWTLAKSVITDRPVPPLPKAFKLHFSGKSTSLDARRRPAGVAFLAALVIRNLARVLRNEINLASEDLGKEKEEKKKHLLEERFGLPIPENILKEEEEEERDAYGAGGGEDENGLPTTERQVAEEAFKVIEERIAEVVQSNLSGLSQYLGEALGW